MKNKLVKFFTLLLCVSMLVSIVAVFSSCKKKTDDAEKDMTVIVEGGVTSYKIVRPEKIDASVLSALMDFKNTISDKCACDIDFVSDWVKNVEQIDPNAKEILVGNTNRPETAEILETLEPNSWAVVNKGNKIVICANNNALLGVALDWFLDNCLNEDAKTLKVEKFLNKNESFGDGILISANGVSGYRVVYPKNNNTLEYYASLVQRKIGLSGNKSAVVDDATAVSDFEIVIGDTTRGDAPSFTKENEYSIKTDGAKIFINATDEETLYYAVNYYIEYGLTMSDNVVSATTNYEKNGSLTDYYSSNWQINLPYIEEGVVAPVYNIGPGLVNDSASDTITDSYLHVVYDASRQMFENYAKKLESFGFKKSYSANTEDNELWGFRLGAAYAYVHYSPREGFIRVIWDKSSNCEVSDIEYTEEQTGVTTLYQYSIDLAGCELVFDDNPAGWGMLYIVKLQDNSLVMIDGGDPAWDNKSMKGLTDFLYNITGTDKNTPLNIRLWYFTHPDDDHNGLNQLWINYLKSKGYKVPNIENVAFNYGSARATEGYIKSNTAYQMIDYMNTNYPDVNYIKLHTGMVFNIGELNIEVLGSIENMVGKNGKIPDGYDTNDTCTVARFTIGGKKFFFSGDTGNHSDVQNMHLNLYSNDYFKSDVNQIAHHGINMLIRLNRCIDADYILVSNGYEVFVANGMRGNIAYFESLVRSDKIYYAGNYNTAFEISNGKMTVKKIPRYDHPTGNLDPSVR